MTITNYTNGIGGSTGDSLALAKPLSTSGNVWYVDSATGVDAGSAAGQNREFPVFTIAQAITNSSDDDIIVCLDGHAETIVSVVSISKRLTIVGEGSSAGVPTVIITNNQAAGSMFAVAAINVQFRNIKFATNTQSCSVARVTTASTNTRFVGCYFACARYDDATAVLLNSGATYASFESCTFISTETTHDLSTQPESAIKSGAAIADLSIADCVFSSGVSGFANFYAVDLSAGACTRVRMTGLSLLLGADIKLHASSTGYVNVQTTTGGAKVVW